jgi:hypothetical protein
MANEQSKTLILLGDSVFDNGVYVAPNQNSVTHHLEHKLDPDPQIQKMAEAGLSFFNDVITEEALKLKLPIIDLRDVCAGDEAFANPIEPSEIGGDLITNAIISHLL